MPMMPFSPKLLMPSNARPRGLSRRHLIRLGQAEFVPDLSGGLFWPAEKTLIVSDLHLEHGTSLARRGLYVPPFDTALTLATLRSLIADVEATRLILLGDSFHDGIAHNEIDEDNKTALIALTQAIETHWISGNHDPLPPEGLGGHPAAELALGNIVFRHHQGKIAAGACEVSGHLHPGASVHQRGRNVHAKCFVGDGRRLIMPAFGAYTGALTVAAPAFDGLFDETAARAHVLGRNAIHSLPLAKLR
jgi:hypothetical protein